MYRERSFKERLPCQLTEREKLSKGQELVARLGEKEELEERAAAASKDFKRAITVKDQGARDLATEIRTGVEYREIDCQEVASFAQNVVQTIRVDTGETIRSRAMLLAERQGAMEFTSDNPTEQ